VLAAGRAGVDAEFGLQRFCFLFVFTTLARAAQTGGCRCGMGVRLWHAHHLVGDAIGVALEGVVERSDRQFRLKRTRPDCWGWQAAGAIWCDRAGRAEIR
jgi:hypothetical protein